MSNNHYAPPKSHVADVAGAAEVRDRKPSIGQRFLLTASIGFPVFMLFVLFRPSSQWFAGSLGSGAFGVLAGVIAMFIPVKSKWLFVVPSLLICLVAAYFIGTAKH